MLVLVWTAVIYATLPIARRLSDWLIDAGYKWVLHKGPILLIAVAFAAAVIYILKKLDDRRAVRIFLLANVGLAYGLFLKFLGKIPIERIHLLEYGLLAMLAKRAADHRMGSALAYIFSAFLVADIGLGDELIQWVLPDRYFDWRDVATNAVSGLLGLALWACLFQGTGSAKRDREPDMMSLNSSK